MSPSAGPLTKGVPKPDSKAAVEPVQGEPAAGALSKDDQSLEDAAHDVELLGRGSESHTFGGVTLDDQHTRLTIQVVGDDKKLRGAARRHIDDSKIKVKKVQRTYQSLLELGDKVAADYEKLRADGIKVWSSGPSADDNALTIRIESFTEQKKQRLQRAYGAEVRVEDGEPIVGATRQVDSQPWYGGLLLGSDRGGLCTGGPPARRNGAKFLLLAGHCFPRGAVGATLTNNYVFVGQVTESDWVNNGLDVALAPVDTIDPFRIFRTHDTVAAVSGWRNPSTRSIVCKSGISTNEVCALRVFAIDQTLAYDGVIVRHQSFAGPGTGVVVRSGDSGGPVYFVNVNGSVTIAGTTGALLGPVPCADDPFARCANSFSFSEISYALTRFNLTIP